LVGGIKHDVNIDTFSGFQLWLIQQTEL
jgi:hypothetical protein